MRLLSHFLSWSFGISKVALADVISAVALTLAAPSPTPCCLVSVIATHGGNPHMMNSFCIVCASTGAPVSMMSDIDGLQELSWCGSFFVGDKEFLHG